MSVKLLIFGGTFEGRMLAEGLSRCGIPAHVFTATDYGGSLVQALPHIHVSSKRLNAEEMQHFMETQGIVRVIDATHPYAREVTQNIVQAAKQAGVEYIRLVRQEEICASSLENDQNSRQRAKGNLCNASPEEKTKNLDKAAPEKDSIKSETAAHDIVRVANSAEAVAYLATTQGAVLLTTGSKELDVFCSLPDYQKRLFIRVLPMPEVLDRCFSLGFSGSHIIAMQGPFSYPLNAALLQHCECRYLVTKNTSQAGGMDEKISAALDNGVKVVLIERPVQESGLSLDEVFALLGINKE